MDSKVHLFDHYDPFNDSFNRLIMNIALPLHKSEVLYNNSK